MNETGTVEPRDTNASRLFNPCSRCSNNNIIVIRRDAAAAQQVFRSRDASSAREWKEDTLARKARIKLSKHPLPLVRFFVTAPCLQTRIFFLQLHKLYTANCNRC